MTLWESNLGAVSAMSRRLSLEGEGEGEGGALELTSGESRAWHDGEGADAQVRACG